MDKNIQYILEVARQGGINRTASTGTESADAAFCQY